MKYVSALDIEINFDDEEIEVEWARNLVDFVNACRSLDQLSLQIEGFWSIPCPLDIYKAIMNELKRLRCKGAITVRRDSDVLKEGDAHVEDWNTLRGQEEKAAYEEIFAELVDAIRP